MKIIIDGIEIKKCGFCERYYSELICPCYLEKQNSEIQRLLNNSRYFNTKHLIITPYQFEIKKNTSKFKTIRERRTKILIACEESQEVCKAFRKLGHEAFSCDLLPCSGGHPEWHIQRDVLQVLDDGWDLMIAHPPCTYLTRAGTIAKNQSVRLGIPAMQLIFEAMDQIKKGN